jgi:hypothetical protein
MCLDDFRLLLPSMRKVIVAMILLLAGVCLHPVRAEEGPLAGCANWVIAHGTDNAIQSTVATLLLDVPRDLPVRQKAFQDREGALHVIDVTTDDGEVGGVFLIVASPDRTRNVFFATRADGILRRTAAAYEDKPALLVPNTSHRDLFVQEVKYWRNRLPKD